MELSELLHRKRTLQRLLNSIEELLELLLNNPSCDQNKTQLNIAHNSDFLYALKNQYINEMLETNHKIDSCCTHDWVDDYIENVYNSTLQHIKYCSVCEKNYDDTCK